MSCEQASPVCSLHDRSTPMRFLIYDNELLFSEALSSLLIRRGHEVPACPADERGLLQLVPSVDADALLAKVEGPISAIEPFVARVKHAAPYLPVVVLAADLRGADVRNAVEAGADGVCMRIDSVDEIESVLLHAAASPHDDRGRRSPVWSRGAAALAKRTRRIERGMSLTPKERAVLELLVQGASTPRMALDLGVGEATVRTHLQHLFNKFGVHSRLALVAAAVRANAVRFSNDGAQLVGAR